MAGHFDRSAEDLGNIVALEHVNVLVPVQGLATLFYVSGLGLTRDPYMMTSTDNMWVNVGRSQFHLPTGKPQKLRGKIGLVIPDRELLLQRLERMKKPLAGTKYGFKAHNAYVEATCPWGNIFRLHDPLTTCASQLGTNLADYFEARRFDFQHLRNIFAEMLQFTSTIRASFMLW